MTDKEEEQVVSKIGELINLLGWEMISPDKGSKGTVIGTPDFIEAWKESQEARKGNLQ